MKKEQEQEEIEWYKDRIKWLADNCEAIKNSASFCGEFNIDCG